MIKRSIEQGSPYAAVMLTGGHGVRMQYNYVGDSAGRPGGVSTTSPRWLRLIRSGDTLTGYESPDGKEWSEVSKVRLPELPETVQVGMFVASPSDLTVAEGTARFTNATAVFDHISLQGEAAGSAWAYDDIGALSRLPAHLRGRAVESGGTFTVTGAGDIAPRGFPDGQTIENTLIGTWLGTIAFIVIGATFFRYENRRDPIVVQGNPSPLTPLPQGARGNSEGADSPAGERVLAAKAIVVGATTFLVGLAAVAGSVILGERMLRTGGNEILPVTPPTAVRVIVGTAAVLGLAAVLALALSVLFRRRLVAAAVAISVIVLPLLVAVALVLPISESHWGPRLAASRRVAMAAKAHAGRWVRDPAEHSRVSARDRTVHGDDGLLPAVTVGRFCRALRIHGTRLRTRRFPAATKACVALTINSRCPAYDAACSPVRT
jgi:hypothetical protein